MLTRYIYKGFYIMFMLRVYVEKELLLYQNVHAV